MVLMQVAHLAGLLRAWRLWCRQSTAFITVVLIREFQILQSEMIHRIETMPTFFRTDVNIREVLRYEEWTRCCWPEFAVNRDQGEKQISLILIVGYDGLRVSETTAIAAN